MAPALLHIRADMDAAMHILGAWMRVDHAPRYTEANGWTTFEVDADDVPVDSWLSLGRTIDIFYESYSTSLCTGEIVYIRSGQLVRHLRCKADQPEASIDEGTLGCEREGKLSGWVDIWGFADDAAWIREVGS